MQVYGVILCCRCCQAAGWPSGGWVLQREGLLRLSSRVAWYDCALLCDGLGRWLGRKCANNKLSG